MTDDRPFPPSLTPMLKMACFGPSLLPVYTFYLFSVDRKEQMEWLSPPPPPSFTSLLSRMELALVEYRALTLPAALVFHFTSQRPFLSAGASR
jgi:hypothetical protein